MHNDEVRNKAAYNLMLDQIGTELGQDVLDIAEMLSHGLTKRKIAKSLNIPYVQVKDKIRSLKQFLAQEYYVGGTNGRKTKKNRQK